jgi:copper/silver efflux system protein
VLLAVPFSAVGAVWFLYALDYNMSVAVWVGLIALVGVDAETGVFMLLYLDLAYARAKAEGRLQSRDDLRAAIMQGAVTRLRPKVMTVATMFIGLIPIMFSTGTGADVMQRIAAPLIGGLLTSFVLELVIYPPLYQTWKWYETRATNLRSPNVLASFGWQANREGQWPLLTRVRLSIPVASERRAGCTADARRSTVD